ncbi:c-type cytochrome [Lentisphaera profundi]|uniref:C-type cytochrome n=1 Tax=Lentisphaera profundi TaxID=1658616 RepID=A0ABY7VU87_9BACT|nr:c-type cytochrome [Lentisphaera profundi]WDE97773.1 c-type cytochrome [Lentisphaera profundi]
MKPMFLFFRVLFLVSLHGALFADANKVNPSQVGAKIFSKVCAQCHGLEAEGNSSLNTPALASQSSIYISEQLHKFKNGLRGADSKKDATGKLMAQQAKLLSSKDIQELSIYLSALKSPVLKVDTSASALRGKELYQKKANCISCHGLYGEGNESMKAPKLNILSPAYIEIELNKFSRGQRVGAKTKDVTGHLMVKVLNDYGLQSKDFKDLANYISGLKNPDSKSK